MQYELNLNIPTIFNLVYMCEKCRHVNERTCKKCSKLQLYISQNLETVEISFTGKIVKQTVIQPCHEIAFNKKKGKQ